MAEKNARPPAPLMDGRHAPLIPRAPRAAPPPLPSSSEGKALTLPPTDVHSLPPDAAHSEATPDIPPFPSSARIPQFEGRPSERPAPPPETEHGQRALVVGHVRWVLAEWGAAHPGSPALQEVIHELEKDFPELMHARSVPPPPRNKG